MISRLFPANISTYGGQIDHVIDLIFVVIAVWFVLAQSLLVYFAIHYRRKPGIKAAFYRGHTWRQLSWVLVPAMLVLACDLGIDAAGGATWETVKGSLPPAAVTVQVTGQQFSWQFTYPDANGQFGTGKDLVEDTMHVPVNQVIHVVLQSADVIHDFYVPDLRLKQDVVPGRKITAWFEATKTGEYETACSQLCGPAHFGMQARLVVQTAVDYAAWLSAERSAHGKKTAGAAS
jgi:cytochrome c oxidase subunit II